ncbi:MAG: hypothetical protein M1827_001732 [Pycnora praestabilis]|nr:MAG: hypothetical protein M1827_001732 [Pycnora praestabilis]
MVLEGILEPEAAEHFRVNSANQQIKNDPASSSEEAGGKSPNIDSTRRKWRRPPPIASNEASALRTSSDSGVHTSIGSPLATLALSIAASRRESDPLTASSDSSVSTPTFSFHFRYYDDDDMDDEIAPKLEVMDDDETEEMKAPPLEDAATPDPPMMGPHPKRPRGRPRKYPLPSPAALAKVTKGARSKTGCRTCRRRKKKCDETKPHCLNCQKNAVVCEGYSPREVWRPGRGRAELRDESRGPSCGLPCLIDGIENEIDRKFLDHFSNTVSRVLTLFTDDLNPFKEILLPMAIRHKGLMHSLLCLSGSHLATRDKSSAYNERQYYHFDCAIKNLAYDKKLAGQISGESQELIDDPTVAQTLVLCLNSICMGETNGEYRPHMDAARHLVINQQSTNQQFGQFLFEFFMYHDVSNSLTSLDRRPLLLHEDFVLPNFIMQPEAGALLGVLDGLFGYMSKITQIRDKIRNRKKQRLQPIVDYQSLSDAVIIDAGIRTWQPSQPEHSDRYIAAQLYRQSVWVYLYRTIQPSEPSDKIREAVSEGLKLMRRLPADSYTQSILLLPMFLLGCAAFDPAQRPDIEKSFDGLQNYSELGNIKPAREIVKVVWEKMDIGDESSWDWETLIQDMGYDFLVT